MFKGLVMVNTGDGKGKTTAAMGMVLRNIGWEKKVVVIQFLKSPEFECGEKNFCKNNGIEIYTTGVGYSWVKTPEQQRYAIRNAWDIAKEKLTDNTVDLLVLDEINCVLCEKNFHVSDIISEDIVINKLKNRPKNQTVILTGRNAGSKIIEFSDLVTEMRLIKHPYKSGISAQKGIEY